MTDVTLILIFWGTILGAIAGKALFSHLEHRRMWRVYKQAEPMIEHATRELYRLPRKNP